MPLKETLTNIIKLNGNGRTREFADLNDALEEEKRVSVAFLRGEITVEEYYARLEEISTLTNTDFRGLAMVSDKK